MSLEAFGLTVHYGQRMACAAIDLSLERGRVIALCGPNGAGKSSLLKALLGLVPSSGTVSLDGRDLRTMAQGERARALAYVPQRSGLRFDLRVREVVEQGRYAHGGGAEGVAQALAACELVDFAQRSFLALSAGEQQRVLLARALATGADWLLLDEPTAALDVGHALDVLERLRALAAAGRGIVCVLHRLEEVWRFADQVVLLDAGRLIVSGEPRAVLDAPRLRAVYGVELRPGAAPAFDRCGVEA